MEHYIIDTKHGPPYVLWFGIANNTLASHRKNFVYR
jgi:hypothetical protein